MKGSTLTKNGKKFLKGMELFDRWILKAFCLFELKYLKIMWEHYLKFFNQSL